MEVPEKACSRDFDPALWTSEAMESSLSFQGGLAPWRRKSYRSAMEEPFARTGGLLHTAPSLAIRCSREDSFVLPILLVCAAFGLVVGSFLNVVILRLPDPEQSIVFPGSHCPRCNRSLGVLENIPVLSWLAQRGRCRGCGAGISVQYPIVEALTAALTVVVVAHFGLRPALVPYLAMTWVLITVTFIDLHLQIIPNKITLPGTLLLLVMAGVGYFVPQLDWPIDWLSSLLGFLSGAGIVFGIILLYWWMTGEFGMGGGDMKLLAMVGALMGARAVFMTLIIGSFLGTFFAMPLMLIGKLNRKSAIPFGPFLAIAAFLTMLYGQEMLDFYKHLLGIPRAGH